MLFWIIRYFYLMRFSLVAFSSAGLALMLAAAEPHAGRQPELLEVRKIWDAAPHNAFTDLARFNGRWFCVFREGSGHVSPDGALRVISSRDGNHWTSVARMTDPHGDLRDAKITITPDHRLMLSGATAVHQPAPIRHQSLAWFSPDGHRWSEPVKIGEPNFWLWRTTWRRKIAYSIGYDTTGENLIRLYRSPDGQQFATLVSKLQDQGSPNESSIVFTPNDTAYCLLRRDGKAANGLFGISRPPYTEWVWKDVGSRIGGPHLLRLAEGGLVGAARLYDGGVRTSLVWIDPTTGRLTECLRLPSGGDTSYPGLVWYRERLWVSYYSSHEGKSCIYLAKVKIPRGAESQGSEE